jgi:hypothetical protein
LRTSFEVSKFISKYDKESALTFMCLIYTAIWNPPLSIINNLQNHPEKLVQNKMNNYTTLKKIISEPIKTRIEIKAGRRSQMYKLNVKNTA